jgi:hypothetical protein
MMIPYTKVYVKFGFDVDGHLWGHRKPIPKGTFSSVEACETAETDQHFRQMSWRFSLTLWTDMRTYRMIQSVAIISCSSLKDD